MDKIKKLMVIVFVIIVILAISIVVLNKKSEEDSELDGIGLGKKYDYIAQPVDAFPVYYTVEACVQKYINFINLDFNKKYPIVDDEGNKYYSSIPDGIENKEDQKEAIYDLLSASYKNSNNIDLKNIENYIKITDKPLNFTALGMNYIECDGARLYSVYGRLEEYATDNFVGYAYFKVKFDVNNMTFSIEPINNCENIDDIILEKDQETVEKNDYNTFVYRQIGETNVLEKYIAYLRYSMLKYPQEIYERLDEEYKNAKFKNEEDFEKYIEERKEQITDIRLDKYEVNIYDDYTQYICMDYSGNYYIFNQTGVMNFDILLDIYTIDLPEFTEKYTGATKQEKVMLNIDKIVEALNAKDYNYIYEKLANEFKENNFKTYEDFKKYASEIFDTENEITFDEYNETGSLSTYKITLTGKNKIMEKTIIIKLEEGTNFVMSFSV